MKNLGFVTFSNLLSLKTDEKISSVIINNQKLGRKNILFVKILKVNEDKRSIRDRIRIKMSRIRNTLKSRIRLRNPKVWIRGYQNVTDAEHCYGIIRGQIKRHHVNVLNSF